MTDMNENAVKEIANLAKGTMDPKKMDEAPGVILVYREGEGHVPLDMRKYASLPSSYCGHTQVFTVDDLIKAMMANGAHPLVSAIFIDDNPDRPAIVGIVDYGTNNAAMWRKDRVSIAFRHTPEWNRFVDRSGKMTNALDFANFIEDNISCFLEPSAAQLMEVVQNFEVRSDVVCKHAVRIDNGGVELSFTDSPSASVKGNKVTVPAEFTLVLSPFQGSAPYSVKAVFRWHHRNGELTFGFKILNVEKYIRDAVNDFKKAIIDHKVEVQGAPSADGQSPEIQMASMRVFEGVAPPENKI